MSRRAKTYQSESEVAQASILGTCGLFTVNPTVLENTGLAHGCVMYAVSSHLVCVPLNLPSPLSRSGFPCHVVSSAVSF